MKSTLAKRMFDVLSVKRSGRTPEWMLGWKNQSLEEMITAIEKMSDKERAFLEKKISTREEGTPVKKKEEPETTPTKKKNSEGTPVKRKKAEEDDGATQTPNKKKKTEESDEEEATPVESAEASDDTDDDNEVTTIDDGVKLDNPKDLVKHTLMSLADAMVQIAQRV